MRLEKDEDGRPGSPRWGLVVRTGRQLSTQSHVKEPEVVRVLAIDLSVGVQNVAAHPIAVLGDPAQTRLRGVLTRRRSRAGSYSHLPATRSIRSHTAI